MAALNACKVRSDILGIPFDLVSYETVVDLIAQWRRNDKRTYVTFTNPHSVMLCRKDENMHRATLEAGLKLPDGVGIVLAARMLRYRHGARVTGPGCMLHLCDRGRELGLRHFLYGGAEGVAEKLARQLCQSYPGLNIVGVECPPFRSLTPHEDRLAVSRINAARPDLVWVGLGAPKQEKWMRNHLGQIEATAMLGVGAAFDFHSGNVRWAPAWIRRLGVEWAFRLAAEPRRMWRRNLDSPRFVAAVFAQMVRDRVTSRAKRGPRVSSTREPEPSLHRR